jgi:hypothetical protein
MLIDGQENHNNEPKHTPELPAKVTVKIPAPPMNVCKDSTVNARVDDAANKRLRVLQRSTYTYHWLQSGN